LYFSVQYHKQVCWCDRTFSNLTMVTFKIRSKMNQQRLDSLMFLSIEQETTKNINYDDIIQQY
jgi:hypothetical protein